MLKIDETVQQLENQIKTNLGTSKTEKKFNTNYSSSTEEEIHLE